MILDKRLKREEDQLKELGDPERDSWRKLILAKKTVKLLNLFVVWLRVVWGKGKESLKSFLTIFQYLFGLFN